MDALDTNIAMSAESMEGGFADPVYDAQSVFSAVMNAMARPGTVAKIGDLAAAPAPLYPSTAAIVLTLCDADTPVWLDVSDEMDNAYQHWILFNTSAPIIANKLESAFAIVTEPSVTPDLTGFAQGSQEYPDRSTTLIIQVDSIEESGPLALTGPGIKDKASLGINKLPPHFLDQWTENRARFPRGVDVIFAAKDAIVCLPRTTKIDVESA